MALAAALGRLAAVSRLLHRLHADEAHGVSAAAAVTVDVDVDRVAVVDVDDSGGPDPTSGARAVRAAGTHRGGRRGRCKSGGEHADDRRAHRNTTPEEHRDAGLGCEVAHGWARAASRVLYRHETFKPIARPRLRSATDQARRL